MKYIAAWLLVMPLLASAAGQVKEVCRMQKDRNGKEVKACKQVKVHQKLQGTKVPPK